MALVYYTAASLDGFIVDDRGSLDWLLTRRHHDDGPFNIPDFEASVGALVMGASTYDWIVRNEPGGWPYRQPTWVLTHRSGLIVDGHPVRTYSGAVTELYPQLTAAAGARDVWLVGGGEVAAQFVAAGLVEEMIVSFAPCSLGAGAAVLPVRSEWDLAEVARNGDFVCARWRRRGPEGRSAVPPRV